MAGSTDVGKSLSKAELVRIHTHQLRREPTDTSRLRLLGIQVTMRHFHIGIKFTVVGGRSSLQRRRDLHAISKQKSGQRPPEISVVCSSFVCSWMDAWSRARSAAPPWEGPSGLGVRISERESAGHSKIAADHGEHDCERLPNFFLCPEEKSSLDPSWPLAMWRSAGCNV